MLLYLSKCYEILTQNHTNSKPSSGFESYYIFRRGKCGQRSNHILGAHFQKHICPLRQQFKLPQEKKHDADVNNWVEQQ